MDTNKYKDDAALEVTSPDIVIITGMSGAGRTLAMHAFEDLGYYVIDNLPPSMLFQLARVVGIDSGIGRHLAVVCDVRAQGLLEELSDALSQLHEHELTTSVIYLDSSDEELAKRYALSRRKNPLARPGESNVAAIAREREALSIVRDLADVYIDTSDLAPSQLKSDLRQRYTHLRAQQMLDVHVFSFGFKYGLPKAADLLIDVRFLPNPYWDSTMRTLCGTDEAVRTFVLGHEQTQSFLVAWFSLLDAVMPGYVAEGKSELNIGVGCSGGQHRSVVLAQKTAEYLEGRGYHVSLNHRDLPRAKIQDE